MCDKTDTSENAPSKINHQQIIIITLFLRLSILPLEMAAHIWNRTVTTDISTQTGPSGKQYRCPDTDQQAGCRIENHTHYILGCL